STLDLNIARAFLGVAIDLDWHFVMPGRTPSEPLLVLLTTAKLPSSAKTLLRHYGMEAYPRVYPAFTGSLGNEAPIERVVQWLRFLLTKPADS
ncbi:hypothetical protein, partial [Asticcacaulis sp. W401b]|uniref:hypothetical protein n=1 Tax=Asticcacaulis sp. W401b TaxID=3388666 RepID=UPI003970F1A0